MCVLVKKIFLFGGILFSWSDLFLAKSDLASTITSNTMLVLLHDDKKNLEKNLFLPWDKLWLDVGYKLT